MYFVVYRPILVRPMLMSLSSAVVRRSTSQKVPMSRALIQSTVELAEAARRSKSLCSSSTPRSRDGPIGSLALSCTLHTFSSRCWMASCLLPFIFVVVGFVYCIDSVHVSVFYILLAKKNPFSLHPPVLFGSIQHPFAKHVPHVQPRWFLSWQFIHRRGLTIHSV